LNLNFFSDFSEGFSDVSEALSVTDSPEVDGGAGGTDDVVAEPGPEAAAATCAVEVVADAGAGVGVVTSDTARSFGVGFVAVAGAGACVVEAAVGLAVADFASKVTLALLVSKAVMLAVEAGDSVGLSFFKIGTKSGGTGVFN
jgi:hypothetical protein